MIQQGQVFRLKTRAGAKPVWAYRYRIGGRGARRVQRGGFVSEDDARAALERAFEKLRRERGIGRTVTLAEFVDEYLAQHEASPVTLKKLRFLLTRAVQAFGDYASGLGRPHLDAERHAEGASSSISRLVFGSTERRRSRTYPAVGYTTSPVLKV
jgi:hypothetical protein